MRRIIRIFIFVIILVTSFQVNAQRVGLVMSGGGAKGMAHIGVIKALEENNIPIDYITGTSIGAVIGSLYAMGYTTDEMIALFKSQDFYNWYTGHIDERYTYYYKQYDDKADMLKLGIRQEDSILSIVLPTNLIASPPMDLAFLQIFAQYSAVADYDFDNLFVPFRCMATDVYNNKSVVLGEGDLGLAVRASMTFPFYFKPVSIDGDLLFDGGIINNFPEDVMRETFDPEMIIGSKVASNIKKPHEDDLLQQIENIILTSNTKYEIKPEDGILIANEFEDVRLLDFSKIDALVSKGYNSTMELMDSIKERVPRRISRDSFQRARKAFKETLPEMLIDNIYIEGVNIQQKRYVRKSLKQNKRLLSLEQFEKAYFRLIADNQIESAMPIAKYNKQTGFFDLHLKVKQEKPYHLRFGANVASNSINQAFFGVDYKLLGNQAWYLHANMHFGRLYTSFQGLTRIDFPGKLPFYVKGSMTSNRWDFFKTNPSRFFVDMSPAYLIQNDNNLRVDIGFPVGSTATIEAGGAYGRLKDEYYQTNHFLQTDTADITRFDMLTAHVKFERNTLNRKLYPNRGVYDMVDTRYIRGKEKNNPGTTSAEEEDYGYQHAYGMLKLQHSRYFNISEYYTIGAQLDVVASNQSFYRNYISTLLSASAFTPTPHSKTLFMKNFRAHNFAAVGFQNIFTFTNDFNLRLEGYAFAPLRDIVQEENQPQIFTPAYTDYFPDIRFMANANLLYHTPVGPVSFSVNYYEEERTRWFFMFHFGYILFNDRVTD
ncbi:MAG: patatin-like phospholipase family protein [Candidatus Delongbacteria bacterium]|jgi:NTE family protein|nr:patatin-like phospholipase family protein [Candidatus Delongbacteria bacterium]